MGLQEVDWEVEMAFVIGRRGKHIKVIIGSVPPKLSSVILPADKVSCIFTRVPLSGGRGPVLRGRVHRRQRRQRTWLADEAQWEAVATGKNLWQFLSFGTCVSHHRLPERWEGKHGSENRTAVTQWKQMFVV